MENLIKSKIREIPDWPKKGVNFKDITPLIEDGKVFRKVIDALAAPYLKRNSRGLSEIMFKNVLI